MKSKLHLETRAIHNPKSTWKNAKSVSHPIYLSTTFLRNGDGSFDDDYIYTRADNPNRSYLESCLAELSGGEACCAFSSGMAAISAVFQSLSAGDHVILPNDVYYVVRKIAQDIFSRWNLEYSIIDLSEKNTLSDSIKANTKLIWLETPSNPSLKITDIKSVVKQTENQNILIAVDNTWATPILQRPLELGADLVVHSTTKYISGHSDVLGGCVVFNKKDELFDRIKSIQTLSGAVPSAFDCWLTARGLKTLPLRVLAQTERAEKLASFLDQHDAVESVNYPGLPNHKSHTIAQKQMVGGCGAMLSVLIKGDARRAIDISNKLTLFATATSLGGVESLVEHRKSIEGPDSPTPDNLLRLSVGLEHIDDLIADWKQALK